MISATEALERLRDGNRRFVDGDRSVDTMIQARRIDFAARQEPLAVILGCSDSRVPVEVVFDQGFGDLFVIRVAGNIVAPSQIGSVEFAVERLGTRLVVVLGHTRCGAVQATLEDLQQKQSQSWNMSSIVSRIRPSVEGLLATDLKHDHAALVTQAVRANVRASVNQLRHGSDVLERLMPRRRIADRRRRVFARHRHRGLLRRAVSGAAMYRLHAFAQSGNTFKVAFMLRALALPYESVFVDYFGGATREPQWREGVNEMGEIPVLEDGERRLTQSGAILTYLAAKHGRFGGETEDEKLEVLRWLLFDNHKFTSYFGTYRFMKSFAPDAA